MRLVLKSVLTLLDMLSALLRERHANRNNPQTRSANQFPFSSRFTSYIQNCQSPQNMAQINTKIKCA